ncbi:MAG: ATP-binding cassette domain-containing protein, partial [Pirellulales bacterium]|nr:ATP-binding cassette domain-containing protein [Pirellulales bacterium]
AKLILGLIHPTTGRLRVFGRPANESRLRIGYMPQHLDFDPRFPVSVMDIVLTGRLGQSSLAGRLGWYSAADRRMALEALAEVGMESLYKRPLSALSGGQRQRVLIARALCCRPDILLLDEPTANLDTPTETRLFEVLRGLNRRMTILVISHDVGFVSNLVEKVVCVNRDVVIHPTKDLDGRAIHDLYEGDVRMVLHSDRLDGDSCCGEHTHDTKSEDNDG